MQALRRSSKEEVNQFPKDVLELQAYVGRQVDGIEAVPSCIVPGQGSALPMWILGSRLYGAQLAAALGLPYGFASHFAPSLLTQAIEIYRETFKPSNYLDKPYVLAGFNVFAAENKLKSKEQFELMKKSSILTKDNNNSFYIYKISTENHEQVGCFLEYLFLIYFHLLLLTYF